MAYAEPGERLIADPNAYRQLEYSFRRLLNLYPAAYRENREEEMVATLMEASAPGQRRPSFRDKLDLAAGAARAHLKLTLPTVPGNAIRVAALPAALLLAALLTMGIPYEVISAFGGHWLTMHLADGGPALLRAARIAVVVLPALVGVAMTVALIARKHMLVRRLALFVLPVVLLAQPIINWHVAVLLSPYLMGPALLAALVAFASQEAFAQPWPRLTLLALAAFALPTLSLHGSNIAAAQITAAPATPELLWDVPGIGLVVGLALTAALLIKWHGRIALLASALIAAPMIPELAVSLRLTSPLAFLDARVLGFVGIVSFVLGVILLEAFQRRAGSRAVGHRSTSA
jgi:hypothetical protein